MITLFQLQVQLQPSSGTFNHISTEEEYESLLLFCAAVLCFNLRGENEDSPKVLNSAVLLMAIEAKDVLSLVLYSLFSTSMQWTRLDSTYPWFIGFSIRLYYLVPGTFLVPFWQRFQVS